MGRDNNGSIIPLEGNLEKRRLEDKARHARRQEILPKKPGGGVRARGDANPPTDGTKNVGQTRRLCRKGLLAIQSGVRVREVGRDRPFEYDCRQSFMEPTLLGIRLAAAESNSIKMAFRKVRI